MEDTETQEVKEEETNENTLASQQHETNEVPAEEADKEEDPEKINWRKFREERERERREKAELEAAQAKKEEEAAALRQVVESLMENQSGHLSQQEQDDIIADLMDDDIPTGKDIKQFITRQIPELVGKLIEDRERKAEEARRQQEIQEMPQRLRTAHKDFDQVVSQENLDYLDYHHPEIAKALGYMPNGFEKWSSVYKMVQKLVPNTGSKDIQRMEANAVKPQQGPGPSSASATNEAGYGRRISEEEKRANYERLRQLARGA